MAFKPIAIAGGACLWACLFHSAQAADAAIYKSTGPHGEVTYAWRPRPGAVRIEAVRIETLSPEQRRAAIQLRIEDRNAGRKTVEDALSLEAEWQRVDHEVADAIAAVEQAETDLQNGRVPLPGERLGKEGGGSRLTQAYFDRIRSLELAVQQARQRLDQAYQVRNELR